MPKIDALMQIRYRRAQMEKRKPLVNRGKRQPVWLYPITVEKEYNQALQKYVSAMEEIVEKQFIPHIQGFLDQRNLFVPEVRHVDAWADDIENLTSSVKLSIDNLPISIASTVSVFGDKTSTFNSKEWSKQLNAAFGVDIFQREPWLNDTLSSWTKENTSLIKKMSTDYVSRIEGVVQRGVRAGQSLTSIVKEIRNSTDVTKSKANFIARDQVGKLNGQLTELRQTNIGVTKYVWHDSDDSRVRQTHAGHDSKTFSWDKPPANTGHPGEDYQCRCWAEPIFDEIFEELKLVV